MSCRPFGQRFDSCAEIPGRECRLVVSRRGERAFPFRWKIQRRRQAMGVKVSDCGYRSYRAAQDAETMRWIIF
jgi:hypothetical protein